MSSFRRLENLLSFERAQSNQFNREILCSSIMSFSTSFPWKHIVLLRDADRMCACMDLSIISLTLVTTMRATARDPINNFLRKCLHDAGGIQRGSSWTSGRFSCLSRVTLICDFHAQTRSKECPLYPINQFRITVLKTLGKSKSLQEWLNCRVCFMMHINPCINPKGLFHKSTASVAYNPISKYT